MGQKPVLTVNRSHPVYPDQRTLLRVCPHVSKVPRADLAGTVHSRSFRHAVRENE
jgi:hypothetical protein